MRGPLSRRSGAQRCRGKRDIRNRGEEKVVQDRHEGRRSRRDRGAAAIEFALVLPLLLLAIAGIIDFGRAFFTQISLTNAAREAVRAAVVSSPSTTDIQNRAQAASPGLTVTTSASLCTAPGTNASVTVSSQFSWILIGPATSLVGSAITLPPTLSSTAVMKCGG
ncbi:TadE/TadG family type IV pilus assembly protein [Intrasporangium oryzae]|uniref:TadE/TadG family type IV pilus assembly protein n=1 Tax=Intrasporangium oryzae TaxID=412687 RepID=UPI000A07B7CA|nr:TadE/TadG family type IV pilus assembly protein [Intrasporangium oryzae]